MDERREPLDLNEVDQNILQDISLRRKKDEVEIELEKWRPGKTEMDALLFVAMRGVMACCLGTGIMGGVVGTFIMPILGTISGFMLTVCLSFFVAAFFALHYVLLRGRVSIEFMMTWASVNAGMCCAVVIIPMFYTYRPSWLFNTVLMGGYLVAGGCCGLVTRLVTFRMLRDYQLLEGRGKRKWWQFGILDLLIQTTSIAVLVMMFRLMELGEFLPILVIWCSAAGLVAWLITCVAALFVRDHDRAEQRAKKLKGLN